MDNTNKNIDESWKETVEKEKGDLRQQGKTIPPEADFTFFVTSLALQASIALGLIENPLTGKKDTETSQAKLIIDTLGMLQEKTRGNLNAEETTLLENALYELRIQYIAKTKENQNA